MGGASPRRTLWPSPARQQPLLVARAYVCAVQPMLVGHPPVERAELKRSLHSFEYFRLRAQHNNRARRQRLQLVARARTFAPQQRPQGSNSGLDLVATP